MSANRLILGTNKGLLVLDQKGSEWRLTHEAHRAIPVTHGMTDPRTGTMWACLDHGHYGTKVQRSRDGGASWDEVTPPRFPEGTEQAAGVPATVSYIWLIAPGMADTPDRLYVGAEPGALFQSDDGGESFELVEGLWNHPSRPDNWFGGGRDLPGVCSIAIDPRDDRRMVIGISVGGVFETCDGGVTWEGRNKGLKACYLPNPDAEYGHDPHFLLRSPANPDVLWQQNHCGIFRSTDCGLTWTDISQPGGPAYFGFAIAVDEHDADTAWVVPAVDAEYRLAVGNAVCVCRTEDGGKTWTDLRNGLPQRDAFDLTYRHALDNSGDRLAFGTTTGNLYLSDDRGDSWQCLSNNLPPVLSVRFSD
jgi:photosystem II stability/assembly factor-like uncharacterized protein